MTWGFISESSTNDATKTCWVTVAIIVSVVIFILFINDLTMNKQNNIRKIQKNVKFYDDIEEEDDEQLHNRSQCPYNN